MRSLKPLKESRGVGNWCGPSAISMLTGRTVGFCAKRCAEAANTNRWPRRRHTKHSIAGLQYIEIKWALRSMGYEMVPVPIPGDQKTLNQFMYNMRTRLHRIPLLVGVTRHCVVTKMGKVHDNFHPDGVPYEDSRWKKKRIVSAYIIRKV